MKSFRELFWAASKSADKWDPYFDVYEFWLQRYKNQSPRILEIGVQNGGSTEMLVEYFGAGTKLVGIDIDPRCQQHANNDVEIIIGDQSSEQFWDGFFQTHTEEFDIVIDDGSHRMFDMKLTFLKVNSHVRNGGIYIIEDTHTAYWNNELIFPDIPTGALRNHGLGNHNNIYEFTKLAADVMNRGHIEPHRGRVPQLDPLVTATFERVRGLHYYNSMIVFEIGQMPEFRRCINSGQKMI